MVKIKDSRLFQCFKLQHVAMYGVLICY
ncbi:protein of unknown function [Azospirillum baldaniorum]|uniref:Uncharacterized protein n=1 Tax=Azospirillum baldaniorum TaxID=1064539 RepID=A0A9P1JQ47_9PROT|nr:protein of unknown function [Azospirillum baldaniorum]